MTEHDAITNAVITVNPNTAKQTRPEIYYVNRIGPPLGQTTGPQVEGIADLRGWIAFVEDFPNLPRYNSRENISAHEIGHALGAEHTDAMSRNDPVNKSVMYRGLTHPEDPLNPCEVRRRAWGKVNPTTGDDGTQ
jgi:hypothetical protein